jgi:hypothetical protein
VITPIISSQSDSIVHVTRCLFSFLGYCNYDPANAPIFFSLGDAVAAFGLIFAVYQLRTESWKAVLRIRQWWQRNLFWIFGGVGLAVIAFSALLRGIPVDVLSPPFNYPLFDELSGFLFFIAAPVSLFILSTRRKGLFNKKRAKIFYLVLLSETARPKDAGIEACVNIIADNLSPICKSLQNVNRILRARGMSAPVQITEEEQYANYADAVISVILNDEKVARYIATKRLDILNTLLVEFKKNGIDLSHTRFGLERIFEFLFRETSSYFYSQLDYRGMTLASNVFQLIFSDPYFVTGFKPFNGAHRWTNDIRLLNRGYLTVYLQALEYAVEGYWKNGCLPGMASEINSAFTVLGEYSHALARFASEKRQNKEAMSLLMSVQHFLGHTYICAYRDALGRGEIIQSEKDVLKYDSFNQSVNYSYAEAIYEYLEALSMIRTDREEQIRLYAMEATTGTISLSNAGVGVEKITETIIKLIWGKIETGPMSNAGGYWPAVLRIYILMVGFKVDGVASGIAFTERVRVIEFLHRVLEPKILAGEKMADNKTTFEKALLPKGVVFNHVKKEFQYFLDDGSYQIMN